MSEKIFWTSHWAIFSLTHLVTLAARPMEENFAKIYFEALKRFKHSLVISHLCDRSLEVTGLNLGRRRYVVPTTMRVHTCLGLTSSAGANTTTFEFTTTTPAL
jgi:hypothetical protein